MNARVAEFPLVAEEPGMRWPTDNKFGIPVLNPDYQADAFDTPVEVWGRRKRGSKAGTYVFYTDDTRLNALWSHPYRLLKTKCVTAVEPNFSIYDDTAAAVALWQIYRKRTLARYWQSKGIRICVDLNVAAGATLYNLLGVPKGWLAYATRGYADDLAALVRELKVARHHAGTDNVLFMVYGGGRLVREWCLDHAVYHVSEQSDQSNGRFSANGEKTKRPTTPEA